MDDLAVPHDQDVVVNCIYKGLVFLESLYISFRDSFNSEQAASEQRK